MPTAATNTWTSACDFRRRVGQGDRKLDVRPERAVPRAKIATACRNVLVSSAKSAMPQPLAVEPIERASGRVERGFRRNFKRRKPVAHFGAKGRKRRFSNKFKLAPKCDVGDNK